MEAVAQAGLSYLFRDEDTPEGMVLLYLHPGNNVGLVDVEKATKFAAWGDVRFPPNHEVLKVMGSTEQKDVYGGMPGLGPKVQFDKPVQRPKRIPLRRRRKASLVPNTPITVNLKQRAQTLMERKDIVRTAAGARKYGQPIGSVIVADIEIGDLNYERIFEVDGYDDGEFNVLSDKHGDTYVVGPDPDADDEYVAVGEPDDIDNFWDDIAVQNAASEEEAARLLDAITRQKRKPGTKPVNGSKSDNPTKINLPKRSSKEREADAQATRAAQAAAKKPAAATRAKKAVAKTTSAPAAKKKPSASTRAKAAAKKTAAKKPPAARKPKAKKEWQPGDPYRQVGKGKDVMGENPIKVPARDIESMYERTFKVPKTQTLAIPVIKPGSPTDQELRRQFVIPPAYTKIRYNVHRNEADSDDDYVGLLYEAYDPPTDKWQAVFSTHHWERQGRKKFGDHGGEGGEGEGLSKVGDYLANRDKLIARWKKDAKSKDPKISEPAKALWLQAVSGIRVGGRHSVKDAPVNRRYGASTLEIRHVKHNPDGSVTLAFMAKGNHQRYQKDSRGNDKLDAKGKRIPILNDKGKNLWPGKPYSTTFNDPELAAMLKSAARGRGKNEPLFGTDASKMNRYFDNVQKDMGITAGLTTHNLRHGVATLAAAAAIQKRPKPKTEEEYQAALDAVCQEAARAINDSALVAFQSYIDHNLWGTWLKTEPGWIKLKPREAK